jgi:hypothetical protein
VEVTPVAAGTTLIALLDVSATYTSHGRGLGVADGVAVGDVVAETDLDGVIELVTVTVRDADVEGDGEVDMDTVCEAVGVGLAEMVGELDVVREPVAVADADADAVAVREPVTVADADADAVAVREPVTDADVDADSVAVGEPVADSDVDADAVTVCDAVADADADIEAVHVADTDLEAEAVEVGSADVAGPEAAGVDSVDVAGGAGSESAQVGVTDCVCVAVLRGALDGVPERLGGASSDSTPDSSITTRAGGGTPAAAHWTEKLAPVHSDTARVTLTKTSSTALVCVLFHRTPSESSVLLLHASLADLEEVL